MLIFNFIQANNREITKLKEKIESKFSNPKIGLIAATGAAFLAGITTALAITLPAMSALFAAVTVALAAVAVGCVRLVLERQRTDGSQNPDENQQQELSSLPSPSEANQGQAEGRLEQDLERHGTEGPHRMADQSSPENATPTSTMPTGQPPKLD